MALKAADFESPEGHMEDFFAESFRILAKPREIQTEN